MLIFDTENKPILLDSVHTPTIMDHMWVLDLNLLDYTLAPLLVFEEIVCSTLVVRIKGFEFPLPAKWNILVYDKDTSQLDVVELEETAGREFTALVYGPKKGSFSPATITVMNYYPEWRNVAPSLHKHQMLCHPIGPDEWVNVSPSDGYNKYLKDRIVGDLIGY
jgi:hypothetical protein